MSILTRKELGERKLVDKLAKLIVKEVKGRCLVDEPLARHTSFRTGGPARFYVYPDRVEDISTLIRLCDEKGLQTFVIGYGTNLLVSDDGFAGCVIDLTESCRNLAITGNRLESGSGNWSSDVIKSAAEHGLAGMHRLAGIPGGLGGLLFMNGGAFRTSISDFLTSVEVMDLNGKIAVLRREEVNFEYRSAPGLKDKIILGAIFELDSDRPETIMKAIEETITDRYRRNVMTLPSAGSVFKNPPGMFAAKLIESVGGKGIRMGGVEVSPNHANFIVNDRGGTSSDIVNLIRKVRGLVEEQYDVSLYLELKTLGFEGDQAIE